MSLINAWIVPDFDIVLDWLAASSIYRTMCSECTCMYMWRKKQRRQIHCKYIFFPKINTNHTFVSQIINCYCLVIGNIWPIWRSSFERLKLCNAQHKARNALDGETTPTRIPYDGDRKGTTTTRQSDIAAHWQNANRTKSPRTECHNYLVLYARNRFTADILPDLEKFVKYLLKHGLHLWVQFHPGLCMGGSRPNDENHLM